MPSLQKISVHFRAKKFMPRAQLGLNSPLLLWAINNHLNHNNNNVITTIFLLDPPTEITGTATSTNG